MISYEGKVKSSLPGREWCVCLFCIQFTWKFLLTSMHVVRRWSNKWLDYIPVLQYQKVCRISIQLLAPLNFIQKVFQPNYIRKQITVRGYQIWKFQQIVLRVTRFFYYSSTIFGWYIDLWENEVFFCNPGLISRIFPSSWLRKCAYYSQIVIAFASQRPRSSHLKENVLLLINTPQLWVISVVVKLPKKNYTTARYSNFPFHQNTHMST